MTIPAPACPIIEMAEFFRKVRGSPDPPQPRLHLESRPQGQDYAASPSAAGKALDGPAQASRCPTCGGDLHICVRCGREVDGRDGLPPAPDPTADSVPAPYPIHWSTIWLTSLAVWIFLSIAATLTIYQMYRVTGNFTGFREVATMEFSQLLSYLPLTPFAFWLAIRYPTQRGNWATRVLLHLGSGLVFAFGHIVVRGATPYGYWDGAHRQWNYTFWDVHSHSLRFPWPVLKSVYLANVFDDITSTYLPIILIAHALLSYHNSQQKELRATQLSGQLAKARLRVLKNQMQPHFLFNTLHSISALMLTNVAAADRMMTSLSDLLRMSLEDKGDQLTSLNRDLEFLGVYVEIEKARFEDKLRVNFDIEPECLDAQVPHMFLQPLVENAVRHGTSKRSQPGEINVIAKHRDENLEMWIQDNGPGFVGTAEDVFARGLGLSVTRERLKALYGNAQRCKIGNAEAGGAEVYVLIPFRLIPNPEKTDAEHKYQ